MAEPQGFSFDNWLTSPTFQIGASVLGAPNIGVGLTQGAQSAQAMALSRAKMQGLIDQQNQARRRQEAWNNIFPNGQPNTQHPLLKNVPPEIAALAATYGPDEGLSALQQYQFGREKSALAAAADKRAAAADARMAELHKHQLLQAQYAAKTAERQFNEPKPNTFDLGEGHIRYEIQRQPDGSQRAVPIAQGGVKQDAASKKAIWEAQDELPALQSTIEALERAKVLNPNAYTGMTAGARGRVMTGLPFEVGATGNAKATAEYQSLLNQQAIEAMSRTLKGATTDREMGQFLSILGDLSQPPELRARVINRMLELAQRQKQVKAARIQELGGKTPDFAVGGALPAPQQSPQGVKTLNGKTYINIDGQWYEQ